MDFIENNDELCSIVDNYFNEKDFIYKSSNPIQSIAINNYSFSVFQDGPNLKDHLIPFFLTQAKHVSLSLQSEEVKSEANEFKNKKLSSETQIDIEPKFDLSDLDKLYQIEIDKCSNTNDSQIEKKYFSEKSNSENKELNLPDNLLNSKYLQKFSNLTFDEFSLVFAPVITNIPVESRHKLIQNMYNRIHHH